jgi:hypothetical protein
MQLNNHTTDVTGTAEVRGLTDNIINIVIIFDMIFAYSYNHWYYNMMLHTISEP